MHIQDGMEPLALPEGLDDELEVREYIDAGDIEIPDSDYSDDDDLPTGATASTGRRGSLIDSARRRQGIKGNKTVHFEAPPSAGSNVKRRASISAPPRDKSPSGAGGTECLPTTSARLPLRRGSEASNTGAAVSKSMFSLRFASLYLAIFANEFSRNFKFEDAVYIATDLHYDLL